MAPHVDVLLAQRVLYVDVTGDAFPVTLLVDGMLLSGDIISADLFQRRYAELGEEVGVKTDHVDWDELREKAKRRAQGRLDQIDDYLDSLDESESVDPARIYALAPKVICLEDVSIQTGEDTIRFVAAPDAPKSWLTPMRLNLASIAGWRWGTMGTVERG